jgi:hypothetical protein
MWALLASNQIISHKLLEWLKFTELCMAMVLGSVEDERCLSNLSFTKSKLRNRLTTHLDSVLRMYALKKLFFGKFPIFYNNEIMDTKEGSKGRKTIATF